MSKNPKCKTCKYRGTNYIGNGCDYIEFAGHSRGCPVEEYDKYEKKPRKKRSASINLTKN